MSDRRRLPALALLAAAALLLVACDDETVCPDNEIVCPGDHTAPTVAVTAPADGDTVAPDARVTITAEAADDEGLDRVQFLLDGVLLGEPRFVPPWETVWAAASADRGEHELRARAADLAGNVTLSEPVTVRVGFCDAYELAGITRTDETGAVLGGDTDDWCPYEGGVPTALAVDPAYPNPCWPACTIQFAVPAPGEVTITIVDDHCRPVRTLIDGALAAGLHQVIWNTQDDDGAQVPDGIYGCVVTLGEDTCYGDIEVIGPPDL